jgi:membrane protein implicated in regulation of membrane protease activity
MTGLGTASVASSPGAIVDLVPYWIAAAGAVVVALVGAIVSIVVAVMQRRSARRETQRQLENQGEQWQRELGAQREQFRDQVARDHQKWRLESRSETYVNFIVSVQRVCELIASFASAPSEVGADGRIHVVDDQNVLKSLVTAFHKRYDDAFKSGQLVRLHGPSEVRIVAENVISGLVYLRNTVDGRLRSVELNLPSVDGRMWHESTRELSSAVEEFITTASSVLDSI